MSRVWIKLDATYVEDDAIVAAGALAELLFIRSLAYCRRRVSDGKIPRAVVPVIASQIPAEPFELAARLVHEGLWFETDSGYEVRSWADWQVTSQQLKDEAARKKEEREQKRKERQPRDVPAVSVGRPSDADFGLNRNGASGVRQQLKAVGE